MLVTKLNVLQPVPIRLTLCWTESTTSKIISELAQKSSDWQPVKNVVRYDRRCSTTNKSIYC
jgi:hypothetical protein